MSTVYHTSCRTCGVELTPENFILKHGKPRPDCKACWNAYQRARRAADPEKARAYDKANYERRKHTSRYKAQKYEHGQQFRKNNPQYDKEWYKAHPERHAEVSGRRRASITNGMTSDPINYSFILKRDGLICCICSAPIDPTLPRCSPGGLNFEHDIPLRRGGLHTYENIHPSHHLCNLRKFTKTLAELTDYHRREL